MWWVGLVWSRPGAADSFSKYVGAVVAAPAVCISRRIAPGAEVTVGDDRFRVARHRAIVLVNHDELRDAAMAERRTERRPRWSVRAQPDGRAGGADGRARGAATRGVPDLGGITVRDHRQRAVAPYGSPIDPDQKPDEAMIGRHVPRVAIAGPAPTTPRSAGPVTSSSVMRQFIPWMSRRWSGRAGSALRWRR